MEPGRGIPQGWTGPNPTFFPKSYMNAFPEEGRGVSAWFRGWGRLIKHPHIQHWTGAMAIALFGVLALPFGKADADKSMTLSRDRVMEERRQKHATQLQAMGHSGEWGPIKVKTQH